MNDDIKLKPLDAIVVAEAFVDYDKFDDSEAGVMSSEFDELFAALDRAGLGSNRAITRRTARPDGVGGVRMHVGVVVEPGTPPGEGFEIVELPAVPLAATLLHRGSLATLGDSWLNVLRGLHRRPGLQESNTESREVHVHAPVEDTSTESWVTELQLPVAWTDEATQPVDQ